MVPVAGRSGHLDGRLRRDHDFGHCLNFCWHVRDDLLYFRYWDHRASGLGDAYGDRDFADHVHFGRHLDSDLMVDRDWHLYGDVDLPGYRDFDLVRIVD